MTRPYLRILRDLLGQVYKNLPPLIVMVMETLASGLLMLIEAGFSPNSRGELRVKRVSVLSISVLIIEAGLNFSSLSGFSHVSFSTDN